MMEELLFIDIILTAIFDSIAFRTIIDILFGQAIFVCISINDKYIFIFHTFSFIFCKTHDLTTFFPVLQLKGFVYQFQICRLLTF